MQTVKFKGQPQVDEDGKPILEAGKPKLGGMNFGRQGWIAPGHVMVLTDDEYRSIKENGDKRFALTNEEAPDTGENDHKKVLAVELDAMNQKQLGENIDELVKDGKKITVDKRASKAELRAAIDIALREPVAPVEPTLPPTGETK